MAEKRSWGGTRAGAGNPFFGKKHTPEFRAALSARQYTWTEEDLTTLRRWYVERENAPLRLNDLAALLGRPKTSVSMIAGQLGLSRRDRKTGRKPTAKHATPEARREAQSRSSRERIVRNGHPRGMLGKTHTPEVRAILSAKNLGRVMNLTDEQRQAMSDRSSALHATRPIENAYSRCKYGRRADLGDKFFRSRWEANYARYLNLLVANGAIRGWEYEAETFWFEAIRRGVRSYKPDFKITEPDGTIYFVEVKGWMDPKSVTKIARMAKYHPTVDLRVVGEKAYKEIARHFAGAIAEWERG